MLKEDQNKTTNNNNKRPVPTIIIWRNVVTTFIIHLAALYGFYLMFTSAKWRTNIFAFFLDVISNIGVTAGVHRLWSHRSYKAKLPLRILYAFFFSIAFQKDIYGWARDHRVHHKHSDTDADPHNINRGFFFSHMGWILCRKHPELIEKGKKLDVSDVLADPVVRFHKKYYMSLCYMCCFILPTFIPIFMWKESIINAFFVAVMFRWCISLHQIWLVNSAAHRWGNRPYDANINPRESNLVIISAFGEGFHNYHHTFPYDYSASEYGNKYNISTVFINFMAYLGLAYDLKTVPPETIARKKLHIS